MTNLGELNFGAFDKKWKRTDFTPQQLAASEIFDGSKYSTGQRIAQVLLLVLAGLVVVGFIVLLIVHGIGISTSDVGALLFMAVFFASMMFFARKLNGLNTRSKLTWLKFALDNNLTYSAHHLTPPDDARLFKLGDKNSQTIDERIDWPNNAVELGDFCYAVSGQGGSQTIRLRYFRIKLERAVPHLILNNRGGLPIFSDENVQEIELEGDFNKFFALLAPPDCQVDARQIFTPDVMQTLLNIGKGFDYELVGDELYVCFGGGLGGDSAQTKRLFTDINQIADQIEQNVRFYNSDDQAAIGTSPQ
ncbi:MAG: hypothetical protein LBM73_00065 [Candidatus Nomurabacteria bacterium]|jgi:hypothetical protein|nr:hypothetical protein [Candidatus Nomurabacteria bacterium]